MVTVRIDAERTAEENLDYAEKQCGRVKALSEQVIVLTRERDGERAVATYWREEAVRLTRERDEARRECDWSRELLTREREGA